MKVQLRLSLSQALSMDAQVARQRLWALSLSLSQPSQPLSALSITLSLFQPSLSLNHTVSDFDLIIHTSLSRIPSFSTSLNLLSQPLNSPIVPNLSPNLSPNLPLNLSLSYSPPKGFGSGSWYRILLDNGEISNLRSSQIQLEDRVRCEQDVAAAPPVLVAADSDSEGEDGERRAVCFWSPRKGRLHLHSCTA
jgi:hypothetical protein